MNSFFRKLFIVIGVSRFDRPVRTRRFRWKYYSLLVAGLALIVFALFLVSPKVFPSLTMYAWIGLFIAWFVIFVPGLVFMFVRYFRSDRTLRKDWIRALLERLRGSESFSVCSSEDQADKIWQSDEYIEFEAPDVKTAYLNVLPQTYWDRLYINESKSKNELEVLSLKIEADFEFSFCAEARSFYYGSLRTWKGFSFDETVESSEDRLDDRVLVSTDDETKTVELLDDKRVLDALMALFEVREPKIDGGYSPFRRFKISPGGSQFIESFSRMYTTTSVDEAVDLLERVVLLHKECMKTKETPG
ncbi:MAG: hypothetical protein ABEJ65_08140 [bacterium]